MTMQSHLMTKMCHLIAGDRQAPGSPASVRRRFAHCKTRHRGAIVAGLILVAGLLFTTTAIYFHRTQRIASPIDSRAGWLESGPWGRISFRRIRIAPAEQRVFSVTSCDVGQRWTLDDLDNAELARLLTNLRVSMPLLHGLINSTRTEADGDGFVIDPPASLVRRLPHYAREQLYDRLSHNIVNLDQVNAFRYWGKSVTDWLEDSELPAKIQAQITQLTYRNGHLIFFADLPLVFKHMANASARRRLVRTLCSQSTLRLVLHIEHGQDVRPLINYWTCGPNRRIIQSRLSALAHAPEGGSIDVRNLLPIFARQRLYTYPHWKNDLPAGQSRDCHWSALNFSNQQPDLRFADKRVVSLALYNDFHRVAHPRLGDLVELMSGNVIFHSAVYIADGVIFTRNGARPTQPWILLPLKVMKDFYPESKPIDVIYLQRDSGHGGTRAAHDTPRVSSYAWQKHSEKVCSTGA